MITEATIMAEKERLYESSSLRDDLNDSEATVLLQWGEAQVERLAQQYPDDFEQQARFLRQVIKGINRFVGQREFNDEAGQKKYLDKVLMYLPKLGWDEVSEGQIMAQLPADASDMAATLSAILGVLSPQPADDASTPPAAPTQIPEKPDAAQVPGSTYNGDQDFLKPEINDALLGDWDDQEEGQ